MYQDCALDDVRNMRIIDRAAELGLIVVTHMGYDVGFPGADMCSPAMARHVIDEVGEFPFVLAHMGGWKMWDVVPEYLADTGCYLDTAFSTGRMYLREDFDQLHFNEEMLDTDEIMKLFNAFGSKRILFGTDSPWAKPGREVAFIEGLPIGEGEKEDIFFGNAERLLGK